MRNEIIKITCDRCGKEMIPTDMSNWFDKSFRLHTSKRKIIMTREQKEMDLCKDCYESLRNWYYRKGERKGE